MTQWQASAFMPNGAVTVLGVEAPDHARAEQLALERAPAAVMLVVVWPLPPRRERLGGDSAYGAGGPQ